MVDKSEGTGKFVRGRLLGFRDVIFEDSTKNYREIKIIVKMDDGSPKVMNIRDMECSYQGREGDEVEIKFSCRSQGGPIIYKKIPDEPVKVKPRKSYQGQYGGNYRGQGYQQGRGYYRQPDDVPPPPPYEF